MAKIQDAGNLSIGRSHLEGSTLNENFKLTKQLVKQLRPSLDNNSPNIKKVREMGASFDMGSKVGMNQINTAEATTIKQGPELGKGSLVDEVF